MRAYEILGRIDAGLQLCGQEEDGTWQWLGTFTEWQKVEQCEQEVINSYEYKNLWN